MSGFTIVIKAADGQGRTQLAAVIRDALAEKGFTDVHVVPVDKADIPNGPMKDLPVTIVEG